MTAPIPPSRPLVGNAFIKVLAMGAGAATTLGLAVHAKTHSTPPDADGTSFMRRDRAEAKEYFSGLGGVATIALSGALLCVPMLYGWPRGAMLDTKAMAMLSSNTANSVAKLGSSLAHSDMPETALTYFSQQSLRSMPREVRAEIRAAAIPAAKNELLMTQVAYGLGGGGLFGSLIAGPVVFGDDNYDTRHFPKD